MIVKSISAQHGRDGARATLRYVARLRESDRTHGDAEPQLYDEWGDPVARGLVLDALDAWGLPDEREAESDLARALRAAAADDAWRQHLLTWRTVVDAEECRAAARTLARQAGLRVGGARAATLLERAAALAARGARADDLEPARRYGRVATRHFAATVPLADERQAGLFEIAVAAFVREAFAAEGRRVLWAVHVEHGKEVHAHLLVRNLNDGGRAQVLDRAGAELDRLREALARHARGVGIAVEATRHGDRPELVNAVVDGGAALPRARGRNEEARGRGVDKLRAAAPGWLVAHGPAYARRLLARARGQLDSAEAGAPSPVPAGHETLLDALIEGRVFGEGVEGAAAAARAIARFAELRVEMMVRTGRDTLARWYLVRAPLLFGPARHGRRVDPAILAALFRSLPAIPKSAALPSVDEEMAECIAREISVIREERRNAHQRSMDLARLRRQREQLARHLEAFGGTDHLQAAAALKDRKIK